MRAAGIDPESADFQLHRDVVSHIVKFGRDDMEIPDVPATKTFTWKR